MEIVLILLIVLAVVGGAIGAFTVPDWRIKMIAIGVIALATVHFIGVIT